MIIHLSESVRKIHVIKNGFTIASIFRWRGNVRFRGTLNGWSNTSKKIFYQNGTIEKVKPIETL